MKAVLVDDERNGIEVLEELLKKFCPAVNIVGKADSVKTAVQKIKEVEPDLVFLDIQMPGGTGFDVLKGIDSITFEVIFVTAHDKYAINAFRFAALDYLLKPINIDELKKAVSEAEKRFKHKQKDERLDFLLSTVTNSKSNQENSRIVLPILNGYQIVDAHDITYCKSESNYTRFYFSNGSNTLVSRTLKDFEEILEENKFFRAHRSSMVNLNYVSKYLRGKSATLVMKDGTSIIVAPGKKDELMGLLAGHKNSGL